MATATAALPVMDLLKSGTRTAHDAVEAMDFGERIIAGSLPRDRYVQQLLAFRRIHAGLEQSLATSDHRAVRAVWHESMAKAGLLDRDIEHYGAVDAELEATAAGATGAFVRSIDEASAESPLRLLGCLYVLEGSQLGGMILRRHLAEAFELEGEAGIAYYCGYGNQLMRHWTAFKDRMNDAVTDPGDQQFVLDAARDAFTGIGTILQAILADDGDG